MVIVRLSELAKESGWRRKSQLLSVRSVPAYLQEHHLACTAAVVDSWEFTIEEWLVPTWDRQVALRDSAEGLDPLETVLQQAEVRAENVLVYQTEKLGRWVARVEQWVRGGKIDAARSAVGVDVSPYMRLEDVADVLRATVKRNVSLITGISHDTRLRVEALMFDSLVNRRTKSWLRTGLGGVLQTSRKHAALVARDQTQKLTAVLDQQRNEQLGIRRYRWRTVLDGRERDTHAANHLRIFAWRDPPATTGHPGTEINCRCSAQAILEAA